MKTVWVDVTYGYVTDVKAAKENPGEARMHSHRKESRKRAGQNQSVLALCPPENLWKEKQTGECKQAEPAYTLIDHLAVYI